jgi:outer membrane protein assembly factor BamB
MFNKVHSIDNVNKGFLPIDKKLIYQTDSTLNGLDLLSLKKTNQTHLNNNYQLIQKVKDGFIGLSHGLYSLFDSELNEILTKQIRFKEFQLVDNKFLLLSLDMNYSTLERKSAIYNIENENIVYETDYNKGMLDSVDGKSFFIIETKKVSKINLKNKTIDWFVNIDNGDTIPNLIYSNDKVAIIGFYEKEYLVAFNIQTGEIVWEKSDITKGKLVEKNIIYGFLINYAEFSLEDGKKIKSFIKRDYFEEIGIETQRSNYVLIDNHIITTDWRKGKIGAFNINTFKFDWVYEVDNVSFPSANPIRYSEPYLYVQDNNNTLHIFEKSK